MRKAQECSNENKDIEKLQKCGLKYNISNEDLQKVLEKKEKESEIDDISIETPNSQIKAQNKEEELKRLKSEEVINKPFSPFVRMMSSGGFSKPSKPEVPPSPQAPSKRSSINTGSISKPSTTSDSSLILKPTAEIDAKINKFHSDRSKEALMAEFYQNRGIKDHPKYVEALENRMRIMDAMDDHLASNMLTSLHYLNFKNHYARKDLSKYIFDQRQKRYRKEANMDEQVKVFFRQKFEEVYAIKEHERDIGRRKRVENIKKETRLQSNHPLELKRELEEKLMRTAKEFRKLKKEHKQMKKIQNLSQDNVKRRKKGLKKRRSCMQLVTFSDVPIEGIIPELDKPEKDPFDGFENTDLLHDLKGFKRPKKKKPISKSKIKREISQTIIPCYNSLSRQAAMNPGYSNFGKLFDDIMHKDMESTKKSRPKLSKIEKRLGSLILDSIKTYDKETRNFYNVSKKYNKFKKKNKIE